MPEINQHKKADGVVVRTIRTAFFNFSLWVIFGDKKVGCKIEEENGRPVTTFSIDGGNIVRIAGGKTRIPLRSLIAMFGPR